MLGEKGRERGMCEWGGRQCLAILARIVLSLLSLLPTSPALFCRQCEKRSWRDPGGIPWVESIEVLPRTLYPLAFSCLPRLSLHLSLFPLASRPFIPLFRFLSFNLRLDCRLHIVLFYGFCRSTLNFSSVPRCLSVFSFLLFFLFNFHSLRSKFTGDLIYDQLRHAFFRESFDQHDLARISI